MSSRTQDIAIRNFYQSVVKVVEWVPLFYYTKNVIYNLIQLKLYFSSSRDPSPVQAANYIKQLKPNIRKLHQLYHYSARYADCKFLSKYKFVFNLTQINFTISDTKPTQLMEIYDIGRQLIDVVNGDTIISQREVCKIFMLQHYSCCKIRWKQSQY